MGRSDGERAVDLVVRAVGATTVRVHRTGEAGSAEGEGRPGSLVEPGRART